MPFHQHQLMRTFQTPHEIDGTVAGCPIIPSDTKLLANNSPICINLYNTGDVRLLKELSWMYTLHRCQPFYPQTLPKFSQPTTSPLPSCSSLGRLPVALVVCVCLIASSNGGGFSYGGGDTKSVEDRAGRGAMANSSSVLIRSTRPRLASLLQSTILAYNTETKKSSRMVPMLAPTMIPACPPLV